MSYSKKKNPVYCWFVDKIDFNSETFVRNVVKKLFANSLVEREMFFFNEFFRGVEKVRGGEEEWTCIVLAESILNHDTYKQHHLYRLALKSDSI